MQVQTFIAIERRPGNGHLLMMKPEGAQELYFTYRTPTAVPPDGSCLASELTRRTHEPAHRPDADGQFT